MTQQLLEHLLGVRERLHLAEKTIKHYMTNILRKLHVRSRVEAALLASDYGLDE